jgi:hypothetical protein
MNLPIQEGFALRTGNGYAELEFEDSLAVRLGANSTVEFTLLALVNGGRITRLTVSQGTAIISAKLSRSDAVSVSTSDLNVKVPRSGRFRVDASPAESWVTVFHGKVEVASGLGSTSLLGSGRTLHEETGGTSAPEIASNPPPDAFDKWVSQRETAVNYAQNGTSDVLDSRNYIEGFADLYNFGLWSYLPGYGVAWMPYGVGANWMPFVSGQWMFMGGTGWNWVSSEPWGWLPYHFGAWVNAPGIGWAWLPRGPGSWQPATASWVHVNNQLGWTPTIVPPPSSRSAKSAPTPIVILAARGAGGAITAGDRVPLGTTTGMRVASAPASGFALPAGPGVQAIARPTGSANVGTLNQSAPVSQARLPSGPASLRAPGGMTLQSRSARIASTPPSLLAPHSMPAPRTMAGVSGGFRAGFSGTRGSASGGTVNLATPSASPANVSAHGTGMSSAPHSGGSARSSAGHR